MRAVIQRVVSASVAIDHTTTASIGRGLVILLGIQSGDTDAAVDWLVHKLAHLRVFADAQDRMKLSLVDNAPGADAPPNVLVVSQFTLLASTRKGTRPSFNDAAKPDEAIPLYESFVQKLSSALARPVATGVFGARMHVSLVNDGPVTLIIDSQLRE